MMGGLTQTWNGSVWEDSSQFTCTYDAKNNMTGGLNQTWNGSAWENSSKWTDTYDANNNLTNQLFQVWNGTNWVNEWQYLSTFDANNFEKSYAYKNWNTTATKVTSGDSSYYYYHTVLGIHDLMVQNVNIAVYPNPASNIITVETSVITDKSQLSIINLNGQQLITRQITGPNATLDISSLPNGVYFVRLTSESKVALGKFIKN